MYVPIWNVLLQTQVGKKIITQNCESFYSFRKSDFHERKLVFA